MIFLKEQWDARLSADCLDYGGDPHRDADSGIFEEFPPLLDRDNCTNFADNTSGGVAPGSWKSWPPESM